MLIIQSVSQQNIAYHSLALDLQIQTFQQEDLVRLELTNYQLITVIDSQLLRKENINALVKILVALCGFTNMRKDAEIVWEKNGEPTKLLA